MSRRPIPAIVALLALLLLTALVWWRVIDRSSGTPKNQANGTACPSSSAPSSGSSSGSPSVSPSPTATLPAPADVTVLVLNSTTRSGLAGDVRTTLLKDGFRSPDAATNDTKHAGKITKSAQIRYNAAQKDAAKLLQYYFPRSQLKQVTTGKKLADTVIVSLGKGFKRVATPAAVAKKIRAHGYAAPSSSPKPKPSAGSCT